MECESPQQDGSQAERVAAGSAASLRAGVRHMSQTEMIRCAAAQRNAAVQAELDALSSGHNRSLKRRTSEGSEVRADQQQPPPATNDWLNGAIAASLRAFGEHMDARLVTLAEQGEATAARLEDHMDTVVMMDRHLHEYAETTNCRLSRRDPCMQDIVNATTEMRSELDHTARRLAELDES